MSKTDIQNLEEEMRRMNNRLGTDISKLEKRMQEIVEINQMHINTINAEDDDVEELQKLMETALASVRELELQDKSIQEELTELQEIVRQMSVKINLLEGVKDFNENVRPEINSIGAKLEDKFGLNGDMAKRQFYKKYEMLCVTLGVDALTLEKLMACPIEDFPVKFNNVTN